MASLGGSSRSFSYEVRFVAQGPQAAAQLRAILAQQVQQARAASAQTIQVARSESQQRILAARAASTQAQQLARSQAAAVIEAEKRLTAQYKSELRERERATRQAAAQRQATGGGLAGGVARGIGQFTSGAASAFLPIGLTVVGALAAREVARFSAEAVKAASDLEEAINKTGVAFATSKNAVLEWSKNSAQAFGQSRAQALEAVSTFGLLFSTMGVGARESARMSQRLTELAADIASINNISIDEALIKLRAGLVGEVEPLRTVGVLLNAQVVAAKAVEMGLARTTAEVDEQSKVMARYALILEQTKLTQGDFARTSEDLANAQRIARAEAQDAQAAFGQIIQPAALEGVRMYTSAIRALGEALQWVGGLSLGSAQTGNAAFLGLGEMARQGRLNVPSTQEARGVNQRTGIGAFQREAAAAARELAAALEEARSKGVFALDELGSKAGRLPGDMGAAGHAIEALKRQIDSLPDQKSIDILVNVAGDIVGSVNQLEQRALSAAMGLVRQGLATPAQAGQMVMRAQSQAGFFGLGAVAQGQSGVGLALAQAEAERKILAPFEAAEEAERERKRAADEANRAWKSAADNAKREFEAAAKAARSAFEGALRGVPGLFGTSQVTADQLRMAELGVPQNFADNYLRRLTDEVLNKVEHADVDITDAARRAGISPNLPAEAILHLFRQAWESGALFADPRNLELINQQAVHQALAQRRQAQAGQANIFDFFGNDPTLTALTGLSGGIAPDQFAGWAGGVSDAASAALATQAPRIVDTMNFSLADQLASGETIAGASAVGSGLLDLVWGGYEAGIPTKPWVGALVDHISAEVLEMVSDILGNEGGAE